MRRLFLAVFLGVFALGAPSSAAERADLAAAQRTAALQALTAKAVQAGTVDVIVGFNVPFSPEAELDPKAAAAQERAIAAAAAAFRVRYASIIKRAPDRLRTYTTLPFAALQVTAADLQLLGADTAILTLEDNGRLTSQLQQSGPQIGAPAAWLAGFTGKGQTIAVLDSGIDKTHPFLKGKVISEACYSYLGQCPGRRTESTAAGSAVPCTWAGCEHGTHVAGIAAGRGAAFSGIAPDARLMSVRVASHDDGGSFVMVSDMIAGLERVAKLAKSNTIAAVNLSLGGTAKFTEYCDDAYPAADAAFRLLYASNVAVVAASGNDGFLDGLAFPACLSSAVSVGAVFDAAAAPCDAGGPAARVDDVACFSNSAPFLSLLAPGAAIYSSVPGGGFDTLSGTSMAAAHVAAAFAILRQKFPQAPVGTLRVALRHSGRPITDQRNGAVTPRIQVDAAFEEVQQVNVTIIGKGSVRINPWAVAACTASCSLYVPMGSSVGLRTAPAPGQAFAGWTGDCTRSPCDFDVWSPKSVTARFAPGARLTVKIGPAPGGVQVTALGEVTNSYGSFSGFYPVGTQIGLNPLTVGGEGEPPISNFAGWTGPCQVTGDYCGVTLRKDTVVSARFQ
ncbi:hypothetical protein DK847_05225 [Aestuariivirga litoralis]|uniref:Peptidase S8/S53 domain-containing protein n=1 Tax=Aestuariivirga litoralis TaxID=2650924 RepID=A0A2W2BNJ9_9HYPH|nr:S8 family serine peptidase [Aestuariivirga litoralis]PZF77829.1 hypothetical protein DK847_05225 [Aestuariivirga litoralis]